MKTYLYQIIRNHDSLDYITTIEKAVDTLKKELLITEVLYRDTRKRGDYIVKYTLREWTFGKDWMNNNDYNFRDVCNVVVEYDDFEDPNWIEKKIAQLKKGAGF